jgi:outer membrane receptor protein involved in Fe transport
MKLPKASSAAALTLFLLSIAISSQAAPPENVVVTATRGAADALTLSGNISTLSADELALTDAIHPYELANRVPGAWISRGSGQEQLTAIRSPVLTGPGSCGAFLILEDGIPTRPTGFCNVNQLFEVPTELARSMEVIRGPANAYYGSNALHGTINTLLPEAGTEPYTAVTLETGSHNYWRGRLRQDSAEGKNSWSYGIVADHDGGYRDDSGYKQIKGYVKSRHELTTGALKLSLSLSELDQETAGYILTDDSADPVVEAYKDRAIRFTNPNPEAYRKAGSRRVSAIWLPNSTGDWTHEYRVFLRDSDMEFLQHFLPGQPLEENGQTSGGLQYLARRSLSNDARLTLGIDTELAQGYLEQSQENPTMTPSDFLNETRPAGLHYDYDVDSHLIAGFGNVTVPFAERWELQAGARAEFMRYTYDNKTLDGNTRDDGTTCGFGGCIYNRPADRSDNFSNFAPNVGLLYKFSDATVGFSNWTRGFRVPQATELYRLQRGQSVSDINSETLDSVEAGIRHQTDTFSIEALGYYMRKDNFIFKDSDGFYVSNGKTEHKGVETSIYWRVAEPVYLQFTGSYARQEYRFNRDAALGETISKGNRVDTAPLKLASARLGYEHSLGRAELEWVYTDDYFMDAGNTERYEGHQLLNARFVLEPTERWSFALRINNLTDEVYADRADLNSAGLTPVKRYFPGHPREVYASITWRSF